ncbi:MAG: hypothetical protein FVQ79_09465 [Planctomycetes bacterium]|nr:hypothetical protein [Planctomycetota bacterium]
MPDKLNYIKNMIWMMCCDGEIAGGEKNFLHKAAKEISVDIADWNQLLKEVIAAGRQVYPITDRDEAIATLKSLVVMAKADGKVVDAEKNYLLKFAKAIGITNDQWKQLRKNIDLEKLFDPFRDPTFESTNLSGSILALRDDFDKIDDFLAVASDFGATTTVADYKEFIASQPDESQIVCFHAAPDRVETVSRCAQIQKKAGSNTAAVLTRYQGNQVQYLLEIGLKMCIIEPVYTQDIINLLK